MARLLGEERQAPPAALSPANLPATLPANLPPANLPATLPATTLPLPLPPGPPLLAVAIAGPIEAPPGPVPVALSVRRPRRPVTPLPAPEPATARTPGAPPEATFHRLVDTVVPGLHRCMRSQNPPVPRLQLSLSVGGPRHNGVAMDLGEHQQDALLRACIGRLVHRLHFPASEEVARYTHVIKLP